MSKAQALAFFDLDGTLLNEQSQIDPEVAEALKTIHQRGIIPIIATGRSDSEIISYKEQTGIRSSITMNGQVVVYEGDNVVNQVISAELCQKVLAVTKQFNHQLGFYNQEHIGVTAHAPIVKTCYDFIHSPTPPVQPNFYQHEPVNMLLILGEKEHDQAYFAALPEFTFFRNGPYAMDTITKGTSKGQGVKQLLDVLGNPDLPTYAFGDGPNDIDLFKACDFRIAMGNAQSTLKEIATFVTRDNTDGGIITGLKHYGLLN